MIKFYKTLESILYAFKEHIKDVTNSNDKSFKSIPQISNDGKTMLMYHYFHSDLILVIDEKYTNSQVAEITQLHLDSLSWGRELGKDEIRYEIKQTLGLTDF